MLNKFLKANTFSIKRASFINLIIIKVFICYNVVVREIATFINCFLSKPVVFSDLERQDRERWSDKSYRF